MRENLESKKMTLRCFNLLTLISFLFAINVVDLTQGKSCISQSETKYIDLSYSFNEDTIYFPGQKTFHLDKDYDGVNKSGIWYSAYSFCMGEHGGTHVDAPFHFYKDGWTLDKIPPSHLIDVPAVVIDVTEDVEKSSSPGEFELEVEHLIKHEISRDQMPLGGVVLIHTGWSKYWPDKSKYLGLENDTQGSELNLKYPGLSANAAKWLATERQIIGIGLDTPSVDPGHSKTFPVHVILAQRQVYNIENVANLHTLIKELDSQSVIDCNLRLIVLPIKIIGATGGPARILAYCKRS